MQTECYPISILPQLSRLFEDYAGSREPLAPFYSTSPYGLDWAAASGLPGRGLSPENREAVAGLLERQNIALGAGEKTLNNIGRLRAGAGAVVTGQQVTILGGPLYTLLKAATAIRKAQDATAAGMPQVPVFWLASEDHDLAEADHVTLPSRHELHRLKLEGRREHETPAGGVLLGEGVRGLVAEAAALLGPGPLVDLLKDCYRPEATYAEAFGRFMVRAFASSGLIVIDAASRKFHAQGAHVFAQAISHADALEEALLTRNRELGQAGYHAQVLVKPGASLLFLLDAETGARLPLKRRADGTWLAGRESCTTKDLLQILETAPERLSPNALLRPVFQDAILPTSAYIGGPAEIAYFAQADVVYRQILGRTTPVLPRLSATLVEPEAAAILSRYELSIDGLFAQRPEDLAARLGARTLPVEGKQKLAAAGKALDAELAEVTRWMASLDAGLGRSADVAASKMRYQMNRLRRLAANFQLQKDESLRRQVSALYLALAPGLHPQERVIGGAWFLSRHGLGLTDLLVENASQECPGHKALFV